MVNLNEIYQSADWKKEKHVPVIDIEKISGKQIKIKLMVGKEIPHPNTTAHHIRWIDCYFKPDGEKFVVQVGRADFLAHGASAQGADTSKLLTKPAVSFVLDTQKSGTVLAISYCNIHGLWQNSAEVKL
ncbi:MAG: desulfoferrodoxin family protein [Candidatus Helarchaeota archaeon]